MRHVPPAAHRPLSTEREMRERLDEHERILTQHGLELGALDRRLGIVERDHANVRLLATTTQSLGERVGEALDGVDAIAERAVEKVLERRHDKRRATWKYWAGWTAAAASALGFLADHFHLHF